MKLSEPVLVALIAAVIPSSVTLGVAYMGLAKVDKVTEKVERVTGQVEQVHIATNSMKDALVESTKQAALLKGHAQGVKDEKAREQRAARSETD